MKNIILIACSHLILLVISPSLSQELSLLSTKTIADSWPAYALLASYHLSEDNIILIIAGKMDIRSLFFLS